MTPTLPESAMSAHGEDVMVETVKRTLLLTLVFAVLVSSCSRSQAQAGETPTQPPVITGGEPQPATGTQGDPEPLVVTGGDPEPI